MTAASSPELNPISIYHTLASEHRGDSVVWQHPQAASLVIRLLAPTGLQVSVGYFNNEAQGLGTPLGSSNQFALTTFPKEPRNLQHRIHVEQRDEDTSRANHREDDSTDYLEGLDDQPYPISQEIVRQPELASLVREYISDCVVLDVHTGDRLNDLTRRAGVEQAIEAGHAVIEAGDFVGRVDATTLARFA